MRRARLWRWKITSSSDALSSVRGFGNGAAEPGDAMISLIVARSRNGAIGRGGTMPWTLPEDMEFFKEVTKGAALIMGKRTWASIPNPPLPGRLNCVVTSDRALAPHSFRSVEAAVAFARAEGHDHVIGMGGRQIYEAMMPMADRLFITEVDAVIHDADTFFPEVDETLWSTLRETVLREAAPRCVARELVRA